MEELLSKSKFGLAKLSISYIFRESEIFFFSLLSIITSFIVETAILSPLLLRSYNNTTVGIDDSEFISLFTDNLEIEISNLNSITAFALFGLSIFFVSTITLFFNAAIIESLNLSLNGKKSTFFGAIGNTISNLKNILSYAVIDSIFKIIFRKASEASNGLLSALGLTFVGIGWYYANWFAMPILVTEKIGPVGSIKKSASLFKSKFSEQIISEFSLGLIFLPLYFLAFIPVALVGFTFDISGPDFEISMFFAIALSLTIAMILHVFASAAEQILKLLVYRKAMEEQDAIAGQQ